MSQWRGSPQKRVANLWTEFAARRGDALITNGKEPQNPKKLVVAATVEMAKTELFAEPVIWDRVVGGSNPLAPTTIS